MIIRTNRGLHYNAPRTTEVGDRVEAIELDDLTTQEVVEIDATVGSYSGPIYAVGKVIKGPKLLAGVMYDDGDRFTYADLAGDGDRSKLIVRFYGDGEPTFHTGTEFVILSEDQVDHLIKTLQENR